MHFKETNNNNSFDQGIKRSIVLDFFPSRIDNWIRGSKVKNPPPFTKEEFEMATRKLK